VGQVVEGEDLKELVDIAKNRRTTLVMDEFYSAYIYSHPPEQNGRTVSIAEYVEGKFGLRTAPYFLVF
jgi:aspartate/methionine/tyrosine aminotransferase